VVSGQHGTPGAWKTVFSSNLLEALNKSLHLLVPVTPHECSGWLVYRETKTLGKE